MSRSEATSTPSKTTNSPGADVRTQSYETLPPHVTAWPEQIPPTGKAGFSSTSDWLRDVGPHVGVTTQPALTKKIREGSIPAVSLSTLSASGPYQVTLSGRAAETVVVANDPAAAQPDPGPLRAVVAIKSKNGLAQVPTGVTTSTSMEAEAKDKAARQAVTEALSRTGESNPASVRLAWITTSAGEPKVRHVEYRDGKGEPLIPTAKQDLEAQISKVDFTSLYSTDDLRADVAKRVSQALSIPASGSTATKVTKTEAQGPAGDMVDTARTSATSASDLRATTAIGQRFQTRKTLTLGESFQASQAVDVTVKPTATTPHVLKVFKQKDLDAFNVQPEAGALFHLHAGVASGFKPLLLKGASESGELTPGSQIIAAVREGSDLVLVGAAPYAGVRQGTPPAGQLLGQLDRYQAFQEQIVVPAESLGNANQPVVIAPDSQSSTFQVPAELRRRLHAAATQAGGWGGNQQA